jgi:hypothetical protein
MVGGSVRQKPGPIPLATGLVETRSALLASPVEHQHPGLMVVGGADSSVAVMRAMHCMEQTPGAGGDFQDGTLGGLPLGKPARRALQEPLGETLDALVEGPSGLEAE